MKPYISKMKNEFMIYTSEAEWKDVPDFIGIYQASSDGMVRSLDRMVNHWQGGKCFKRGKILINKKGYKMVRLVNNGIGGLKSLHRVIASTFIDNPENLPQVNHIDGNKLNNRVDNLEWISNIENMRHSFKIGNHKGSMLGRKGELHPRTLLSAIEIESIKKELESGASVKFIAIKYKVSSSTITRSINRK